MADVLLPPWLSIAKLRTDYLDNTGMTRGLYTGAPETTGFGGDRLKLSLEFSPTGTSSTQAALERAALRSFLARLRGRQNRAYIWDPSYRLRGSFPTGELLSNNTFSNGTTGWSSSSSANMAVSAADRVLRAKRVSSVASSTIRAAAVTTVAFAPYVARAMIINGRGAAAPHGCRMGTAAGGLDVSATATVSGQGLSISAGVSQGTSTFFSILESASGRAAGDYIDIPYASVSRCALIDNGPNLLLQSDEFDATWVTTRASVDDQTAGTTAPDSSSTADALHEDATASATHYVEQTGIAVSASALDYSFAVALKAANRSWGSVSIFEATGATELGADFDLTNGLVGTTRAGANWSNVRAFISPMGDGWYYCCVVGRKTNAATSLTARVWAGEADNDRVFTGLNQDSLYLWRATLAQSGVPTRLAQTTTTAITASNATAQTGSGLQIKGLPVSTSGLLLRDDRFEVITDRGSELKIVTASLDSDAAGLGYLQFEPPLMGTPADGAPIIIHQPMTRAIFAGDIVGWDDSPGIITTASAEFEEAA